MLNFLLILIFLTSLDSKSLLNPFVCYGNLSWKIENSNQILLNKISVILLSESDEVIEKNRLLPEGTFSMAFYESGTFKVNLQTPHGWFHMPKDGIILRFDDEQNKCPTPLNFKLSGFSVTGSIKYKDSDVKPENLFASILLNHKILKQTKIDNGNLDALDEMTPGKYSLVISSQELTENIDKKAIRYQKDLEIVNDALRLNIELDIFFSYSVSVDFKLLEEDSTVTLYVYRNTEVDNELDFNQMGCNAISKENREDLKDDEFGHPICQIQFFQKKSLFEFAKLKPGSYKIIPKLNIEGCSFVPESHVFAITKDILPVPTNFHFKPVKTVANIKIIWPNKIPISHAKINYLDNHFMTDEEGKLLIPNLNINSVNKLRVSHEYASFDDVSLDNLICTEKEIQILPNKVKVSAKSAVQLENVEEYPEVKLTSLDKSDSFILAKTNEYSEIIPIKEYTVSVLNKHSNISFYSSKTNINLSNYGPDTREILTLKPESMSIHVKIEAVDLPESLQLLLVPHQKDATEFKGYSLDEHSPGHFSKSGLNRGAYYLHFNPDIKLKSLKIIISSDQSSNISQEITNFGSNASQDIPQYPLPVWILTEPNDKTLYQPELPFEEFTFDSIDKAVCSDSSKYTIKVTKDTVTNLHLCVKKFGFSASGSVKSLISQEFIAEAHVFLEPNSIVHQPRSCPSSYLERISLSDDNKMKAKTSLDGKFKFNGLVSGCEYIIEVMKKYSTNGYKVEKTFPNDKRILISNNDLSGLDFYAVPYQPMGQVTVTFDSSDIEEKASSILKVCESTSFNNCFTIHSFFKDTSLFYIPGSMLTNYMKNLPVITLTTGSNALQVMSLAKNLSLPLDKASQHFELRSKPSTYP